MVCCFCFICMFFLFTCLTQKGLCLYRIKRRKEESGLLACCHCLFFSFQSCSFGFHSKNTNCFSLCMGLVLEALCRHLKMKLVSANMHPFPATCTKYRSCPHFSVSVGRCWGTQCRHLDSSDRGPKATGCIYTAFPLPSEYVCVSMQPTTFAASQLVRTHL